MIIREQYVISTRRLKAIQIMLVLTGIWEMSTMIWDRLMMRVTNITKAAIDIVAIAIWRLANEEPGS
jgi:hypothetical protein